MDQKAQFSYWENCSSSSSSSVMEVCHRAPPAVLERGGENRDEGQNRPRFRSSEVLQSTPSMYKGDFMTKAPQAALLKPFLFALVCRFFSDRAPRLVGLYLIWLMLFI